MQDTTLSVNSLSPSTGHR